MSNHLKILKNNNNCFTNNNHHDLNNNNNHNHNHNNNNKWQHNLISYFKTMSDDLASAKLRSAYRAHYPIKQTWLSQIIFYLEILIVFLAELPRAKRAQRSTMGNKIW